ncbi:MAG: hypothetical protein HQM08_21565 [Candidatus Riflebacteria bacterium]|nr:hypothetical protein [Candidatus Riflebacteria bacterium]
MKLIRLMILMCTICSYSFAQEPLEALNFAFFESIHGSLAPDKGGKFSKVWPILEADGFSKNDSLLISAGDMFGPIMAFDTVNEVGITRLMNLSNFTVMGIHPNDFSIGLSALKMCSENASFPFIFSNAVFENQPIASYQSKILPFYKTVYKGKTILFISLISPEVKLQWPSWDPKIDVEDCAKTLESLKSQAESASFTVLFSTMQLSELQNLFYRFPWLDFAIQNSVPNDPPSLGISFELRLTDGRSVFYANSSETVIGKVKINKKDGKRQILGEALKEKLGIEENISIRQELEKQIEPLKNKRIADCLMPTAEELEKFDSTILNAFRIETKADVCMMDMSGFQNPETKNIASFGNYLRAVYPSIDRVAMIEMTGSSLYSLWMKVKNSKLLAEIIRFEGIADKNGIKINGRVINETEKYRLVTSEFFSLGGMDLFPKGTGKVLKKTLTNVLDDFFLKNPSKMRKSLLSKYDKRAIYKLNGNFSFNLDKTDYSGPISRYTTSGSGGIGGAIGMTGTNYNIPDLIGAIYQQKRFSLDETFQIDRSESDLFLSFKANTFDYNDFRVQDSLKINTSYSINKSRGEIHPILILDYQSSLRPQQQGPAFPKFGELMVGGLWKPPITKSKWYTPLSVFLCSGRLFRTKSEEILVNDGYDFGFQFTKKIFQNWELSLHGCIFGSFQMSEIRGSDGEIALKMPINRSLSTLIKMRRFMWEEKAVGEPAIRRDVFFGLNFERSTRWF